MQLLKTEKTTFSADDILKYINDYEMAQVKVFDKLWAYYKGRNTTILDRKSPDSNNPDNKVPVSYGRKIITTFAGYAYRPRYIAYKPADDEAAKSYVEELKKTFNLNNEHIKTSIAGRNMGILGVSYELLYIDTVQSQDKPENRLSVLRTLAEPRFFTVDPREMILLYDFSSEPKKIAAIRYFKIDDNFYKVEVYFKDRVELYDRIRDKAANKWTMVAKGAQPNQFGEVPVVAYYFGDEMMGLIEPIIPLIDAYDVLISDSLNEYDRFAFAYLVMKKFGLTDPAKKKEPGVYSAALALLKRRRIFEHLPEDADVKYLTKDIPSEFIKLMTDIIRDQIHVQSHVPDFTSEKMSGASGIAIQRLLFDFENICSSNEADCDVGLIERIRLITLIYAKANRIKGDPDMVTISHKRNVPLDQKQFADTALVMKNAGFSKRAIVNIMPDDIIPDKEAELAEQESESQAMMESLDQFKTEENVDEEGNPIGKKKEKKNA
jgi:SPP1 family phage portal protein